MPKKKKKHGQKRPAKRNPSTYEIRQDPIMPDETFQFSCSRCGECCHRIKDAVPVDSLDLFRMAKYLRTIGQLCDGDIATIITEFTEVRILTQNGHPVFLLKTEDPNQKCVFLDQGNTCSLQKAKPRTCRLYPLSVDVNDAGDGLNCVIVSRKKHHFSGPYIRAGDWLAQCFDDEDIAFSIAERQNVIEIEMRLKILKDTEMYRSAISQLMHRKYYFFDLDKPYMPQYLENMKLLFAEMDKMIAMLR